MGLKSVVDDYKKSKAIKIITSNLGRIEETDDAIYCYVDKEKFKEMNSIITNKQYGLYFGFAKVLGDVYIIKKDIVFVFDGIVFEKKLNISIPYSLKFSNCVFTKYVSIWGAKNIEFNGNKCDSRGCYFHIDGRTEKVKFTKDYIFSGGYSSIHISNCKIVEMNEAKFNCRLLNVISNNLIMNDSHIYSDGAEIDSNKIELLGSSSINCSDNLILFADKCNDLSNIEARSVIYNGCCFSEYSSSSYSDYLREQRQKLVNTFAMIKKLEDDYQKDEVKKYSEELKGRPLSRRLEKL